MKTVIREIVAMIIIVAAIILLMITFFFDYIKADSNQPQSAVYKMTENEANILEERQNYIDSQNKIVLSSAYSLDESDLQQYKETNQLQTGQSNPFDEVPLTDILYDAEGNAYYSASTVRNTTNNTTNRQSSYGSISGNSEPPKQITESRTNTTTENSTNTVYQQDKDITAPSTSSGNLTKGTGTK